MKLSVIIPTYNEAQYLPKLMASIRYQTIAPWEIIVADSESSDETPLIAAQWGAQVITVPKKGFSASRGRNAGGKMASGDILCFIDADTILVSKNTFAKIISHVQKGAVGGYFKSMPLEKTLRGRLCWPLINFFKHFVYASSGLIFATRLGYLDVEGFDESREVGEDLYFTKALKKKGPFLYDPSIYVHLSDRRMIQQGYLKVFRQWIQGARKKPRFIGYHMSK